MRPYCLSILAVSLATPSLAQHLCLTDQGSVPPCMVGTWSGANDMAARLDQMFAGLPPEVAAAARPSSGQYLFVHIDAAGRFMSSPLEAAVDVNFFNTDGSVDWLTHELSSVGMFGQFHAGAGDALEFCAVEENLPVLTTTAEGAEGSRRHSMFVPPVPGMPAPAMRYACAGDAMQMFVDLPPPIGTVTYDLIRISTRALPDGLDYLLVR